MSPDSNYVLTSRQRYQLERQEQISRQAQGTTPPASSSKESRRVTEIKEKVEPTIPDDTTLTRNAINMLGEQGYTPQGASVDGRVTPYGSFSIRFQSGREVTPSNYNELVSATVEEQKYQYRLSGSYYVQRGYEPVQTEEGMVYSKREEPQVTTPGYTPQRGDVQKEPGGPIINIQEQDARQGISQGIADMLGLSRMQTQEPYVIVDQYGNPNLRSEMLEEGMMKQIPSEQDIAIGLLQIPQAAFYMKGFQSLISVAHAIPQWGPAIIGPAVSGGSALVGAGVVGLTVKDIVETPSNKMQQFKALVLAGQITAAMGVSGIRVSDFSSRIKSSIENMKDRFGYRELREFTDTGELRLYRHYDVLGKDIRSPFYLKGEKAIDFQNLVKGYHPESTQMTLMNFMGKRTFGIVKGETKPLDVLMFERQGIPPKIFALADIIKTEQQIIKTIKPFKTDTQIQLKLFPSEKASTPVSITDILKRTEPSIIPKKKTTVLSLDSLWKGKGQKLWIDKQGNIRTEELEQLSPKDIAKRQFSLSDITRKPLFDLTKSVETKTSEGIMQILETEKPSRTLKQDTAIESPDIKYVEGSPKLLNYILALEAGIISQSRHWEDIAPGFRKQTSGITTGEQIILPAQGSMVFSAMEKKPIQGEFNIDDVISGEVNINKIIQNQLDKQMERQDLGRISLVTPVDVTASIRDSLQRQAQQQKQMLQTDLTLQQITMQEEIPFEETPIKPSLIIVPIEEGLMKAGGPQSYVLKLRSRQFSHGKRIADRTYHPASKPLSFDDAMSLGVHIVSNNEKASFELEESDVKPRKLGRDLQHWTNKIIEYNQTKSNRWVETSRHRIDSPGELREITMKGIQARMKL